MDAHQSTDTPPAKVPATLLDKDDLPISTGTATLDTNRRDGTFQPDPPSNWNTAPLFGAFLTIGPDTLALSEFLPCYDQTQTHYHFAVKPADQVDQRFS